MLHRHVHDLVRGLAVAAAALAVLLASPAVDSARADAAQVTVVAPGGSEQTLSLGALAGKEDVVGRSYAIRSGSGESNHTLSGFSLAALLEAAGADPFGFSYLEVQRPAGGSVLLSRDQALDQGAFTDGPPLVYATATGTGFLRPSSSSDDLNAADSFEAPQDVTLVLRKGEPLQVRAQASTVRTEVGEPVDFSAVVERAGAGESLAYSWYFDDGHSATGPSARHRFAKRGSYDVIVSITTPGDPAGASDVIAVQVGAPTEGPDRKGGGTDERADAPDHGAATDSGDGAGAPGVATPATPPSATAPQGRPAQQRPSGEPVSGELLNAVADTTAPEPEAATAARTGKPTGDGGGGGVPEAALGIAVTLGLLGAGALIELRGGFAALSTDNPTQRSWP
jgi:PKD domain